MVKLRGRHQFQSKIGFQLFIHLRSQVVRSFCSTPNTSANEFQFLSCLRKGERVPEFIQLLTQRARKSRPNFQVYTHELGDILTRLCEIRAQMSSGGGADSLELLAACREINNELSEWAACLPSAMAYTTNYLLGSSEEVYGGYYHDYQDLWSAYLWNSYHSAKVITNELIVDVIKPLVFQSACSKPSTFTTQYRCSCAELQQATSDILASVPFHLGFQEASKSQPLAVGGLFIMWNLYAAARKDICAGPARDWAIGRLEYIGRTLGINQASMLGAVLKKRENWKRKIVILQSMDRHLDDREIIEDVRNDIEGVSEVEHVIDLKTPRHLIDMPSEVLD